MSLRLGVVMDPIGSIKPWKDSSFAMLLEAQARGWDICYMEMADLYLLEGEARGSHRPLEVKDNRENWFQLGERGEIRLGDLQVILMRKDPPFDMEYVYATYLLEQAEHQGSLVINHPAGLRDANEKLYTAWFPQCCPESVVTRQPERLREFLSLHGDIVLKPLDAMGGKSVYRLRRGDPNLGVIIETMTADGTRFTMAQRYLPEIVEGDKRILLIDGEPMPYALARVPRAGETRANLAAGGRGVGVELSARDRWICDQVGPVLKDKGLFFVGLDVIGDYLTEINVTSPTGIRELDTIYGLNISAKLLDRIAGRLQ
jgi:glutathione synthase